MVGKLSAKIADYLCITSVIEEEDKALYSYGLFVILSRLLFFTIAVILGLILQITIESMVFFVLFCIIRSYAGGVHASSESKCTFFTTISLVLSILCIKFLSLHEFDYVVWLMLVLSSVPILVLSPLDSQEKPLVKSEIKHFRRVSWIITGLIVVLALILYLLELKSIWISSAISMLLESMLLVTGKIKKSRIKSKTKA